MEEDIDKIKEFEDLFGNTPFENIKKIQKHIKVNYIPKSVIEEIIEELDNIINKIKQYGHTNRLHELRVKRKTLQELLEKGNS